MYRFVVTVENRVAPGLMMRLLKRLTEAKGSVDTAEIVVVTGLVKQLAEALDGATRSGTPFKDRGFLVLRQWELELLAKYDTEGGIEILQGPPP